MTLAGFEPGPLTHRLCVLAMSSGMNVSHTSSPSLKNFVFKRHGRRHKCWLCKLEAICISRVLVLLLLTPVSVYGYVCWTRFYCMRNLSVCVWCVEKSTWFQDESNGTSIVFQPKARPGEKIVDSVFRIVCVDDRCGTIRVFDSRTSEPCSIVIIPVFNFCFVLTILQIFATAENMSEGKGNGNDGDSGYKEERRRINEGKKPAKRKRETSNAALEEIDDGWVIY